MRRICETAEDQILYPEIFQATYANARSQLALQGGLSNAEMVCIKESIELHVMI